MDIFFSNGSTSPSHSRDLPESFEYVLQSWDTASKDHQFANFSVCTTWGMRCKKLYLLDVFRARMDYPTLKKASIDLYQKHKPHQVLVEDKSSGIALIQDLKNSQIYSIKAVKPEGDKRTRMFAHAGIFEEGKVLLPRKATWLAEFEHELTSFPTSKYDDQVDSTSQALQFLRSRLEEPGLLTFYREQGEGLR